MWVHLFPQNKISLFEQLGRYRRYLPNCEFEILAEREASGFIREARITATVFVLQADNLHKQVAGEQKDMRRCDNRTEVTIGQR